MQKNHIDFIIIVNISFLLNLQEVIDSEGTQTILLFVIMEKQKLFIIIVKMESMKLLLL